MNVKKKNIPNLLTILRGFLTLVIIALFYTDFDWRYWAIFVFFWGATITDYLDGYLAREWKVVSTFGKIFDPLFDKILVLGLFMLLIPYKIFYTPVFIVFLIRELLVSSLKSYLLSKNKVVPAIKSGKWKMAFQVFFLNFALLLLIFPENLYLNWLMQICGFTALFLAVLSGWFYTWIFIKLKNS